MTAIPALAVCAPVNKFPNSELNKLFGSSSGTETATECSSVRRPLHQFTQFVVMDLRLLSHTQNALFSSVFTTLLKGFLSFSGSFHVLENMPASTTVISVFFFVKVLGRSASTGRKCKKKKKKIRKYFLFPKQFCVALIRTLVRVQ